MNNRTITETIWLCIDCTHLLANGELPTEPTETVPLGELRVQDDVTLGMTWDQHQPTCERDFRDTGGEGCECETHEFSTSPCGGCGSQLAGYRHAATVWVTLAGPPADLQTQIDGARRDLESEIARDLAAQLDY